MNSSARGVAPRLAQAFEALSGGSLPLLVRAWDGSVAGPDGEGPELVVRSRRALRYVLWRPDELGLARAYVVGALDLDGDLADGLRRCWTALRQQQWTRPAPGPAAVFRLGLLALQLRMPGPPPHKPPEEARLRGGLHSRRRDRHVIAHHYDLGNDFYQLILDRSMAYSCAYWSATQPNDDLAQAQRDKLDLICRKLGLHEGMRLLDIGCGWGSLLLHAARHYGVHATGVTLSGQQQRYVADVVAAEGLGDRVDVLLQDYRDLAEDRFDAVASIEMGEHVGEAAYPHYVTAMHRLLHPGGALLLQQISRSDRTPGGGPFIERYIAPDMTMRPLHRCVEHLERGGFEIRQVEALREHYVRTIEAWARHLDSRWDDVIATIGAGWARVWRLYLAGGALAFAENRMGVEQVLAVRGRS